MPFVYNWSSTLEVNVEGDIFCICSDRYLVEPCLALPILRGIPVTLQQFLVGVLSASLFFFILGKNV